MQAFRNNVTSTMNLTSFFYIILSNPIVLIGFASLDLYSNEYVYIVTTASLKCFYWPVTMNKIYQYVQMPLYEKEYRLCQELHRRDW